MSSDLISFPRDFDEQIGFTVGIVAKAYAQKVSNLCKSPIEVTFFVTLNMMMNLRRDPMVLRNSTKTPKGICPQWSIEAQAKVDRYSADFLIRREPDDGVFGLAIECDGHDFHERTKDQAAHDRQRDRAFQAAGLKIFRFTGMEIHKDAFSCAMEVVQELMKAEFE